jgi:carbamoyl-phosphate synthase/aspartate carbamoyltransferase
MVPFDYDFSKETEEFHGVFVSNGPGDPTMCTETIKQLQALIKVNFSPFLTIRPKKQSPFLVFV